MRVIWVLLNLFLSVWIVSIPILAIGWIDRKKNITGKLSKMWAKWVIWSTGIHYDVYGLENLEPDKKYIFMSNHSSALDILLGVVCMPYKIVFLAKKELFKIPIFGWAMHAAGMIRIDRQDSVIARQSVDEAVNILKEFSFLIRKVLSKKIAMKFLPKILFAKDESFEYAEKIERLIRQTNK